MLKKWIVILIPVAVFGISGCASTNDIDTNSSVANTSEKKITMECDNVRSTGSNIGRCKK